MPWQKSKVRSSKVFQFLSCAVSTEILTVSLSLVGDGAYLTSTLTKVRGTRLTRGLETYKSSFK